MNDPLKVVRAIADRLIRTTPFRYRLELAPCKREFKNESSCGLQAVDFGRTFGLGLPGIAYAFTQLRSEAEAEIDIQIEHSDGCKVWLNGSLVYEKSGLRPLRLTIDERSIVMTNQFSVRLRRGMNALLIKSETRGSEWAVLLQPPSRKGSVMQDEAPAPEIGLRNFEGVDERIVQLTNWLVIGPFANRVRDGLFCGLDEPHAPESEIRFGVMYQGRDERVTWTIPKIEILGNVIDPLPWGTNYNWNYHNGGVAWAMQHLAELTGEAAYADYANRFCDFHLNSLPFVAHQVKALHAVTSANHQLIDTPLLDFTLAPSLPYAYRLQREPSFENRAAYEAFVGRMMAYAREGQVRLPGLNIFTRTTPVRYTTWADDMFMGIPFLVQASRCASEPAEKAALLDDAASQALAFNAEVWDEVAQLYRHARYSGTDSRMPHWSRCNGWALWAMAEVLQALPEENPRYAVILAHLRRHVDSLLRYQSAAGFWHNVLDRPDSPEEVSGTAIFTMAISRGVRAGWLRGDAYRTAALSGWKALATRVEPDGTVHDICMGTMCSEDVEYYVRRPLYDNDTHGLFAVLFAGLEVHKCLRTESSVLDTPNKVNDTDQHDEH